MRVAPLRLAILSAVALAAALGGCTAVQPVREGMLYRSGQLSPAELETAVREHDIRTVINLRGKQSDAKWYADQKRLLRELNVKQVDLPLDSAAPAAEAVDELVATLKAEQKPILVHSHWPHGSAGLASGLYRVALENDRPDDARKELAFWQTRHLPFVPGAEYDRLISEWNGGPPVASAPAAVAAKRKGGSGLEGFGFDELDKPMRASAVAEHTPPKRWPWGEPAPPNAGKEPEAPTVVLGPPKALPDNRLADRSDDVRRY